MVPMYRIAGVWMTCLVVVLFAIACGSAHAPRDGDSGTDADADSDMDGDVDPCPEPTGVPLLEELLVTTIPWRLVHRAHSAVTSVAASTSSSSVPMSTVRSREERRPVAPVRRPSNASSNTVRTDVHETNSNATQMADASFPQLRRQPHVIPTESANSLATAPSPVSTAFASVARRTTTALTTE